MAWIEYGVLLAVAIIVTIALVPFAKKLAVKFDAIDYPSKRRVNMLPIPRLGGVAIFGGMLAAIGVLLLGNALWGWDVSFSYPGGMQINYPLLFLAVLIMFGTGFVDDVCSLPPKAKLAGQVIAAIVAVCSGVLFSSIHNPFGSGYIQFGWVSYPLTVFYLVAFANIINLIDGLDGLASGITVITAVTIVAFSLLTNRPDAAVLGIIVIGACLGFLRYNFNPASIFMGDSGALLLGFSLGIISLFAVARSALFISLLVPILAAGVPIIDTSFAILRRVRNHRPIDEADKGHIHHQLMKAGFSQRNTVLIMWAWTAALALCAVLITVMEPVYRIPLAMFIAALSGVLIWRLHLLGPALAHHFSPRGHYRKRQQVEEGRDAQDALQGDSQADSPGPQVDSRSGARGPQATVPPGVRHAPNATTPAKRGIDGIKGRR